MSENSLWAGDQSLENNSWETGCYEHMAEKKCEFSTAKILEMNDARVVVHARYVSVGIDGKFLDTDPTVFPRVGKEFALLVGEGECRKYPQFPPI